MVVECITYILVFFQELKIGQICVCNLIDPNTWYHLGQTLIYLGTYISPWDLLLFGVAPDNPDSIVGTYFFFK